MQDTTDLYAELQVHHLAEPEVIESAYRRLSRMYHPDVNKSPDANERMKRLNLAYEVLRDPVKRTKHYLNLRGWTVNTKLGSVDISFQPD